MLNWGVIGAGTIARVFCNGMRFSRSGRIAAVASRGRERADALADPFGVAKRYDDYEALLADDEIDAVYVSTIHPAHAEWAIKAAAAGKHLLVEKPIGMNHLEAAAMIDAAATHDVFLMEAFMYRCHPQTQRLAELVRDGAIGEVRMIRTVFSYQGRFATESRTFGNALGGGGILDIGCYPASAARLLAGAAAGEPFLEPHLVKGCAQLGPTGVDHYAAATLQFDNGIVAELVAGVDCRVPSQLSVYGSDGILEVPEPWTPCSPCRHASEPLPSDTTFPPGRILLTRPGGLEPEVIAVEVDRDLFTYEADTVAEHLEARQAPAMSWLDTIGNMKLLDRWREEAGLIYEQERRFHSGTLANRPLRRRGGHAGPALQYGTIPGLDKPVARLVQGADRNFTIPYTEVLFDQYFELGGNCFDTSHAYRDGACERNLGAWIRSRGVRDEVVVFEKGGNPPNGTPEGITQELLAGLDGLGMDRVDVWLMHRDNPEVPVGEIVDVLNEHQAAGRMTLFGVSNWSLPRLLEAREYAERNGRSYFSVVSNQFSLARIIDAWWTIDGSYAYWQSASDPEFRRWFEATQTVLVPWSSQASGFFIENEAQQPRDRDLPRCYHSPENFTRRERAFELGRRHAASPINIALAWVLQQPFPVFPIIGTRLPGETRDCLRALDVTLTAEEIRWLDLQEDDPC